ncbi:MAG: HD domain-containing protein [Lachnospiraceae bacterium]|nr:HD domain-containing protein [Lachnospiraceae bacterium]
MNRNFRLLRRKNGILHPAVIALMAASVLLNILLSMVVRSTDLPLYIDTIGTIVATALGGIVPGILTAFVTNAVNFFLDGESIFYAPLNMLIAMLSAAWFGDYSVYKKTLKHCDGETPNKKKGILDLLLYILLLALIGGGIGGAITWYLYAEAGDAHVITGFAGWLKERFGIGGFGCHMTAAYLTDVLDKAVSVAIALMIIRGVPKKVREYVRLSSWRQKPLTMEERERSTRKLRGRMSIGMRIHLIIVFSTLLMTLVALIFSIVSFRANMVESLSTSAAQIAYLAARSIDPGRVDAYLEYGDALSDYETTRERLKILKSSSDEIAFLYVYKIETDGCHVVFDLDTVLSDGRVVPGDPAGTVVPFEEGTEKYKDALLAGQELPTELLKDVYGSHIASYCPVYDDNGQCVCYAVSNVESGLVTQRLEHFIGRVILLFIGFLTLVLTMSIMMTKYHIVYPITGMTLRADELVEQIGDAKEESLKKLEEMDIRTGDEVELLYRALCKLTGDTVYQLNDNRNKSEAINKMQSALLITMADMVESRDSDTGAHVLKTAAYVRIILQGLKRNGYYIEKLSDKYMRDVEMSAPLHDVGKINIPDAILNKPGKLTDEEYEIMKTHTTAGKKILENAISSMEGDNYLKEARNMAAYHHERWDGKGYPEGLHGEVIPLSARVMAIADVFDALSSERVYKPAFPFEVAIKIIQDGAGTQFDPLCVEVFLESVAEVKKILKKYQET